MKKTLSDLLAQHPDKIHEVGDESRNREGYWLYLKTGWQSAPHTAVHSVHEWNMRDLKRSMRDVCPCECDACQGLPEPEMGFDGRPIRD